MDPRTRFEELLGDFADDEMSPENLAEFEHLLSGHEEWREEARQERDLVRLLRGLPRIPAPQGLMRSVRAGVAAPVIPVRRPFNPFLLGGIAAGFVVVVGTMLILSRPDRDPVSAVGGSSEIAMNNQVPVDGKRRDESTMAEKKQTYKGQAPLADSQGKPTPDSFREKVNRAPENPAPMGYARPAAAPSAKGQSAPAAASPALRERTIGGGNEPALAKREIASTTRQGGSTPASAVGPEFGFAPPAASVSTRRDQKTSSDKDVQAPVDQPAMSADRSLAGRENEGTVKSDAEADSSASSVTLALADTAAKSEIASTSSRTSAITASASGAAGESVPVGNYDAFIDWMKSRGGQFLLYTPQHDEALGVPRDSSVSAVDQIAARINGQATPSPSPRMDYTPRPDQLGYLVFHFSNDAAAHAAWTAIRSADAPSSGTLPRPAETELVPQQSGSRIIMLYRMH